MRDSTIGSVMSACPVVVEDTTPLNRARSLMYRARIRHLPVVANRQLVGILTDRDVNLAAYLANDLLEDDSLAAGDACTHDPYTVDVSEPIAAVAREMAKRHIGSALIVEDGRPVGIFTAQDACRHLARILETAPVPAGATA